MTPSVIYIRVSTKKQAEDDAFGIDVQKTASMEYAAKNGYSIDAIFEEAESGSLEERPKLMELHKYCIEKGIKNVIIQNIDRLSREMRIKLNWEYALMASGIRILDVSSPFQNKSVESDLYSDMMGVVAQYAKRQLLKRMYEGKIEKAKQGKYAGGSPPFGYKVENKTLVEDENYPIVKEIFELNGLGLSLRGIAEILSLKGVKSKQGKNFSPQAIKNVLTSNISKGYVQYANIKAKYVAV